MGRAPARDGGVRAASSSSIEIDFYWRGARCRERIALAPNKRNLSFAQNLRGQILNEIAVGTFDYARHFPDSPRAEKPAPAPSGAMSVQQALAAWIERKRHEVAHSSLNEYDRVVRRVLNPAFAGVALDQLDRTKVKAFVSGMTDVSEKRINAVLLPLRGMIADAIEDGLMSEDPASGLRVQRATDVDDIPDPFTPVELTALEKVSPVPGMVTFWAWTGLRPSELIDLDWTAVNVPGRTVTISSAFVRGQSKTTKTRAGRRLVQLLGPAVRALELVPQEHVGRVWRNPNTGAGWTSTRPIAEQWIGLCDRAGVRHRPPKHLRHTYASMMLSAGENVMWVAGQLGHANWSVTATRYARWMPSAAPNAGDKALAIWSVNGQH